MRRLRVLLHTTLVECHEDALGAFEDHLQGVLNDLAFEIMISSLLCCTVFRYVVLLHCAHFFHGGHFFSLRELIGSHVAIVNDARELVVL